MIKQITVVALGLAAAAAGFGQNVISAKAGIINHVEGRVLLDGKAVEPSYTQFPEVRAQQLLATEDGRAEVLLTPGSFVRLGENSSFRMISTRLAAPELDVQSGTALFEVAEVPKDDHITARFQGRIVTLHKSGLYRIDSEPALFRVYEGEAQITDGREVVTVKKGRQVALGTKVLVAEKFDAKQGDDLYRWASRRAEYISMANVASAKSIRDSGMGWSSSGWYFNPWYQMFTYIPMRGTFYSPFGYGYWSPYTVMSVVYPSYYGGGGGGSGQVYHGGTHYDSAVGYNVGSRTATSVSSVSAPSSGNAAASAPSARGGGDSGGRGASSGGGRGH